MFGPFPMILQGKSRFKMTPIEALITFHRYDVIGFTPGNKSLICSTEAGSDYSGDEKYADEYE